MTRGTSIRGGANSTYSTVTGPDRGHYVLDITGYSQGASSSAGPVQGHPYKYTINLKYGDTRIPIDPEIILGSL